MGDRSVHYSSFWLINAELNAISVVHGWDAFCESVGALSGPFWERLPPFLLINSIADGFSSIWMIGIWGRLLQWSPLFAMGILSASSLVLPHSSQTLWPAAFTFIGSNLWRSSILYLCRHLWLLFANRFLLYRYWFKVDMHSFMCSSRKALIFNSSTSGKVMDFSGSSFLGLSSNVVFEIISGVLCFQSSYFCLLSVHTKTRWSGTVLFALLSNWTVWDTNVSPTDKGSWRGTSLQPHSSEGATKQGWTLEAIISYINCSLPKTHTHQDTVTKVLTIPKTFPCNTGTRNNFTSSLNFECKHKHNLKKSAVFRNLQFKTNARALIFLQLHQLHDD